MCGIFLDRDGVIIRKAVEGEYIAKWDEVEFLPGSLEAIAVLVRSGFTVIIVTNQRGVATGQINRSDLEEIHSKIKKSAAERGGNISGIYYCPHNIQEDCDCRKPKAGMLLRAAREHQLRLHECWMVGDAATDIAAGKTAGCNTALIAHSTEFLNWPIRPDIAVDSLASAVTRICLLQE